MAGSELTQLSDLQMAILTCLWNRGQATTEQIRAELEKDGRNLPAATIVTLLGRLEGRHLVTGEGEGNDTLWIPRLSEDQLRRSLVDQMVERLFANDPAALAIYLMENTALTAQQCQRLRTLLDRKSAEAGLAPSPVRQPHRQEWLGADEVEL